jgi:protein-S-isoprenylcysteine O-methyltransferase Ste14
VIHNDGVGPQMFVGQPGATWAAVTAFWVIFAAWVAGELLIAWRCRLPPLAANQDRGSKTLLIISVWSGVALGLAASFLTPSAAIRSDRPELYGCGLIFMVAGLILRGYAIAILGPAFTVTVGTHSGQQVVDDGPYRWVRHPSYTGGLLTVLGVLICCTNLLSLLGFLLPLLGYAYRIRVEERALTAALGEAYGRYMRRTKRLVPFVL